MALTGLLALLDDVTSILDDASTLSQIAAEKTGKIAEQDLTSTFNRNTKLDPKHEISVIMAVAKGAIKNKLLYFIPSTFAIAALAPWAIAPISLFSGAYIAYEATKKMLERKDPDAAERKHQKLLTAARGGKETLLRYEKDKIAQAIKTDAALSLELSGFQLGMVAGAPLLATLVTLTTVSIGATALMYLAVIGIIKMDDVALHLAERKGDSLLPKTQRAVGNAMLRMAAPVLKTLTGVGMAAMFFVGGRLMATHIPGVEHAFHAFAEAMSTNTLLDGIIQTAATAAMGIGAGMGAIASVYVLNKPYSLLRNAAAALYGRHLAAPLSSLGRTLKKPYEKLFAPKKPTPDTETEITVPHNDCTGDAPAETAQPAPAETHPEETQPQETQPQEIQPAEDAPASGTITKTFAQAAVPCEPDAPQDDPMPEQNDAVEQAAGTPAPSAQPTPHQPL